MQHTVQWVKCSTLFEQQVPEDLNCACGVATNANACHEFVLPSTSNPSISVRGHSSFFIRFFVAHSKFILEFSGTNQWGGLALSRNFTLRKFHRVFLFRSIHRHSPSLSSSNFNVSSSIRPLWNSLKVRNRRTDKKHLFVFFSSRWNNDGRHKRRSAGTSLDCSKWSVGNVTAEEMPQQKKLKWKLQKKKAQVSELVVEFLPTQHCPERQMKQNHPPSGDQWKNRNLVYATLLFSIKGSWVYVNNRRTHRYTPKAKTLFFESSRPQNT